MWEERDTIVGRKTGVRKRKNFQGQGGAVGRSIDTDVYKDLWQQQDETVHTYFGQR
jgi:hypothetical protein